MIILAPGALDRVFSAETSPKADDKAGRDSRFSAWLNSKAQDSVAAPVSTPANAASSTAYRNRSTRFE